MEERSPSIHDGAAPVHSEQESLTGGQGGIISPVTGQPGMVAQGDVHHRPDPVFFNTDEHQQNQSQQFEGYSPFVQGRHQHHGSFDQNALDAMQYIEQQNTMRQQEGF